MLSFQLLKQNKSTCQQMGTFPKMFNTCYFSEIMSFAICLFSPLFSECVMPVTVSGDATIAMIVKVATVVSNAVLS